MPSGTVRTACRPRSAPRRGSLAARRARLEWRYRTLERQIAAQRRELEALEAEEEQLWLLLLDLGREKTLRLVAELAAERRADALERGDLERPPRMGRMLTPGRADALWEWAVTLHELGFNKPQPAFRTGEPVNAGLVPLAAWIRERLPLWKPRKRVKLLERLQAEAAGGD